MATTKQKPQLVETPIDERETFVSLSKNISDSEASMEVKLHTLYRIQQTDTKIDKIHLLRGELPEEVRDLEDDITGLKTRIANLQSEQKELEKLISQRKLDVENCKAAITRYEEQRGNVKNSREFDSLSKEIEFQGLERELAEKRIKENSLLLSEKKQAYDEAKEALDGRLIDLDNKNKELVSIIEETAKEEDILIKEIEELRKGIDDRMWAAYNKVRSNARNRLAVVTVQRDACGGCFNKIPPQRQLDIALSKKIIVCEYCGRILVNPDFEKE